MSGCIVNDTGSEDKYFLVRSTPSSAMHPRTANPLPPPPPNTRDIPKSIDVFCAECIQSKYSNMLYEIRLCPVSIRPAPVR